VASQTKQQNYLYQKEARRAARGNAHGREIKFLRLAQVAEFPVKSIDARIVRVSKPDAHNDHRIIVYVAEMREIELLALKPFAHDSEGVGETVFVDAYLDGSHEPALRLPNCLSLAAVGPNSRTDGQTNHRLRLTQRSVTYRT